jgi:hypothetical protein
MKETMEVEEIRRQMGLFDNFPPHIRKAIVKANSLVDLDKVADIIWSNSVFGRDRALAYIKQYAVLFHKWERELNDAAAAKPLTAEPLDWSKIKIRNERVEKHATRGPHKRRVFPVRAARGAINPTRHKHGARTL